MEEKTSLTPQEVADTLKIAKNTVYEIIKRGELNAYRVGKRIRIDSGDVTAFKSRSKSGSPPAPEESPMVKGFVLCGQDLILDILARYLEQHPRGIRAVRSYSGSYNSLYALYHGEVHAAAVHGGDIVEDRQPHTFIRSMLPGIPYIVIHLAECTQGFYVRKKNPKGIRNWEDLRRSELRMVNREKGCSTRILLDEYLLRMGLSGARISGYSRECTSHFAAASAVARGEADFALGNENTGLQVNGIDFIPLRADPYDLVIKSEDFRLPPCDTLMEILHSGEFKSELEAVGGYDMRDTGKIVFNS